MNRAERIAFVCPRLAEPGTVGGAETLMRNLAERVAAAGREVHFLTTCARNHFTWENERDPGTEQAGGMTLHYFPVDTDRDLERFFETQALISQGIEVDDADEQAWIDNNVNSQALCAYLRSEGDAFDCILLGPYLFGLVWYASQVFPERSYLIPCLHDEPFAHLRVMRKMFGAVAGCLYNSAPERDLGQRLYGQPPSRGSVVGMGLEPFEADGTAFAERRGLRKPYVIYAGRREPLKGTPMLADFICAFRERTGIDVKLVIAGSGRIDAPPALTPHILDIGYVSEEEKREAMAGAVAFIHPSVNESLGIVILEAWLAGTPCLVSAFSEVLRFQCESSGGGLWFRAYPEFEAELRLLIERADVRRALGDRGRDYVRREYDWKAVEQRFFDGIDGD